MSAWIERCSEAMRLAAGAGRLSRVLVPALYGCADCGTARMISSATPLGRCDGCGAQLTVLASPPR